MNYLNNSNVLIYQVKTLTFNQYHSTFQFLRNVKKFYIVISIII